MKRIIGGSTIALCALVACIGVAGACTAPPAVADVEHFWPTTERTEGPPPLAVGDSVMLGAVEPLQRTGFEVDVRGCRQFSEGLSVLRSRARTRSLPRIVVVGLGTNGTVTTTQIRAALRTSGAGVSSGWSPQGDRRRGELRTRRRSVPPAGAGPGA